MSEELNITDQELSKKAEFNIVIDKIMNKEKSLSFSALKAFLQSPQHYYRYVMEKETTKAMEEGKMFHMAILEPERFEKEYWVLDDEEKIEEIGGKNPRATKKYKEWVVEQEALNSQGSRIDKKLYDTFLRMGRYLSNNRATKFLMSDLTEKEKKIEFTHNDFNIIGFIDGVGTHMGGEFEGKKYTLDLKKVADASYKKLRWTIQDMKYSMQGAIYSTAESACEHYLICIDMKCNVQVVRMGVETLEAGFADFNAATDSFRDCAETDSWYSSFEFFKGNYINY